MQLAPRRALASGHLVSAQPNRSPGTVAALFWLCLGYGSFIVYGSLLPFRFEPLDLAGAWTAFQQVPFLQLGVASRADWVANGVLYLPLGTLMGLLLLRGGLPGFAALLLAVAVCCLLAFAVEFTQLFFPQRTVSQNDLIAECVGSVLGVVAAPLLAPWWERLRSASLGNVQRTVHLLLQAYAVVYLLFCFFPYDLLLTVQELRDKAQSDAWGWLVAMPNGSAWPRMALQWCVEVVVTMPLGGLLRTGPPDRTRWLRAALIGAAAGAFIEAGQFLIETGVSQGASVLSRALGVAAGSAARSALAGADGERLRRWLRRHTPWLATAYAALLGAVNGWWSHGWRGPKDAVAAWADVQWLPFYYHYYTTEAIALYSLCSVAMMYLPLAALGWAWRAAPLPAAALAVCVACVVEAAKLLLVDLHPDPTNLLIAGASCGLLLGLLRQQVGRFDSAVRPAPSSSWPVQPMQPASRRPANEPPQRGRAAAWLLLAPAAALLGTLLLPGPGPLRLLAIGVVAGCTAAVWWRPALLLVVVPAALPVFDLAPWSGRFFWDEFDWLLLACLSIAWYRTPLSRLPATPRAPRAPLRRLSTLAFGVLAAALAISTLRGLWPSSPFDANSFSSYYSSFNALRIAKGAVWAWLFVSVWRRLALQRPRAADGFGVGINIGLALTLIAIGWERAAFAGWLDFAADYRVSGPFSAMHKGGAYVECFLAVAAAYAVAPLLRAAGHAAKAAAALLLVGTSYALMVTFSRNGYAAFAWVVAAALVTGLLRRPGVGERRQRGALLAALALAAGLSIGVASGPYAQQRLARIGQDLATRQAHWADALAMRDTGLATAAFGMGLGRFPETHFWRSREPLHAAAFHLESDAGKAFLRLGAGAPVYVEQIVDGGGGSGGLLLQARVRAHAGPAASLDVTLCRKWLLTSKDCEHGVLAASPNSGAGANWQTVELPLPALRPSASVWPVPVKLSLITPAAGRVVDIGAIRLRDAAGHDLLANGDFSAGMDRWFFATDTDPPWHIHNLAVGVLFEQGWIGVAAWAAVLLTAIGAGCRRARHGDSAALTAVMALGAFLVSATLNTLIDAPRFLWLLLVLAWLSSGGAAPRQPEPVGSVR